MPSREAGDSRDDFRSLLACRCQGCDACRTRPAPSRPASAARALPLEVFENYVKGLVASTPAAQQRFLELANRQASNEPRILLALWSAYAAQSAHDKALAVASAVPESSALWAAARLAVGLSLIELRRFDGAFKTLSALAMTAPGAAADNALGIVQLRRGPLPAGTATAASYFRRAVDAAPEETDTCSIWVTRMRSPATAREALTWLREVVRFDSADSRSPSRHERRAQRVGPVG